MLSWGIEVNKFAQLWSILEAKFEDDPLYKQVKSQTFQQLLFIFIT